jgi:hypothetical protein
LKFMSTLSIDLRELGAGRTGHPRRVADIGGGLLRRDAMGPRT